jgi:hypothetical protein
MGFVDSALTWVPSKGTPMPEYHLAEINIARMRAPLTDPLMADFVAQLAPVNTLADASPGFIWRLQTGGGDATGIKAYGDEPILVNMSVWESVAHLQDYVYRSAHTAVMRDRKQWFDRFEGAYYALWWVPVGYHPTVEEGKARLDYLREHGETEYAFSFKNVFPQPANVAETEEADTVP